LVDQGVSNPLIFGLIYNTNDPDLIKTYLKKALTADEMTKEKLLAMQTSSYDPQNPLSMRKLLQSKNFNIDSLDPD
jgi:hypothetical protein